MIANESNRPQRAINFKGLCLKSSTSREIKTSYLTRYRVCFMSVEILPEIDVQSDSFHSTEYCQSKDRVLRTEKPDFLVVNNYIYYRTGFASGSPQVNGSEYKLLVPSELRAGAIQSVFDQLTSSNC